MRVNPIAFPLVCIATLSVLLGQAPKPVAPLASDWPMFSHDLSSTRYSPLTIGESEGETVGIRIDDLEAELSRELRDSDGARRKSTGGLVGVAVRELSA